MELRTSLLTLQLRSFISCNQIFVLAPAFPPFTSLEDVFSFLFGELQAHVEQGLLQLLVEGDLLSLHGAGDEPDRQLGVVGEMIEQEVKPEKHKYQELDETFPDLRSEVTSCSDISVS